ncbi:hypothetical protein E5161_16530 [Cohnella pontilimi]|uniref:Uncharacterized protein n=1 Tax=Cohnella pontilimi TaxID=2564100 RepID=A0A4U0FC04_9BACL|nr:hypothetical protein [Cohnella pontilimi]TJY40752.1 hypothetical protein E5161_16530 [Cohnella pontilimi]
MTIRYTRAYDRILDDLSNALATIPKFYEAFEMNDTDWNELDDNEKDVCIRTLADDVFYLLGAEPSAAVSTGSAEYDAGHGVIKVTAGPQLVHVVSLRE